VNWLLDLFAANQRRGQAPPHAAHGAGGLLSSLLCLASPKVCRACLKGAAADASLLAEVEVTIIILSESCPLNNPVPDSSCLSLAAAVHTRAHLAVTVRCCCCCRCISVVQGCCAGLASCCVWLMLVWSHQHHEAVTVLLLLV
jgi:hypothetical protein